MNISNNNTSSDIALAFKFRADSSYSKASDDSLTVTNAERRTLYNTAALDYENAMEWFTTARGQTIGHGKRQRYEDAANKCNELGVLCSACAQTLREHE